MLNMAMSLWQIVFKICANKFPITQHAYRSLQVGGKSANFRLLITVATNKMHSTILMATHHSILLQGNYLLLYAVAISMLSPCHNLQDCSQFSSVLSISLQICNHNSSCP